MAFGAGIPLKLGNSRRNPVAHGTTTNDWVEVEDGGLPRAAAANAIRYVPTHPEVIQRVYRTLPIRHREYTFVDLGSGGGRALLLASHFPFKQIIGVEASPQHHQIAKNNSRSSAPRVKSYVTLSAEQDWPLYSNAIGRQEFERP